MYKILVVEDEERLLEAISDYMTARGMQVTCAKEGQEAMQYLESREYDLVLLDVMIPNINGFTICQRVREYSKVPIVFITARCSEEDQLYGFELGADDYVTKPFSLPVLFAKCNALMIRNKGADKDSILKAGTLEFHMNRRQVFVSGVHLELPPKDYELLLFLVENKKQIVSREQLLNRIWGYDYYGDSRVVDTHIKKLRKALGASGKQIKTVIKVGYCFEGEGE